MVREAFGMYAMEGEGCITPVSLNQDIDECRAMICRFDLDGDGVLSFEEFEREGETKERGKEGQKNPCVFFC